MRSFYVCLFAAGLIAIAVWAWRGSPGFAANKPVPPPVAAAATSGANSQSEKHDHNASAARTIRSTTLASRKNAEPRSAQPAKSQSATAARANPVPLNEAAPPRPAAELFLPFTQDDPSNVFLPSSVQYHAALESEKVDPDWGPYAAEALRDDITSQFGDRFEVALSDCRQNLCEIQIAGRIGNDQAADMRDLQQAIALMKQQPWWSELGFDQNTGLIGAAPDGRALGLWFFSRK